MLIYLITAVRKIQAAKVAEAMAWQELAEVFQGSPGDMPQLLQAMKKATAPIVPPEVAKLKSEEGAVVPIEQGAWPSKTYSCPVMGCGYPPSKYLRSVDSHIRSVHTKVAYFCSFCRWSTFNLDSLQRHEKGHTVSEDPFLVKSE